MTKMFNQIMKLILQIFISNDKLYIIMLSRDIYFIFNVNHASNGPTSIEINNNQTYCIINSSGFAYSYCTYYVYTQTQLLGFIGTGIFIENKSNLRKVNIESTC